jgi:hypothetical protein
MQLHTRLHWMYGVVGAQTSNDFWRLQMKIVGTVK